MPKKKQNESAFNEREAKLLILALEKENLRLHRKIAKLKAENVSLQNKLLTRPPPSEKKTIDVTPESILKALRGDSGTTASSQMAPQGR